MVVNQENSRPTKLVSGISPKIEEFESDCEVAFVSVKDRVKLPEHSLFDQQTGYHRQHMRLAR